MAKISIPSDVSFSFNGGAEFNGTLTPPGGSFDRSALTQENLVICPLAFNAFRVWDAFATNLPATGASDDLGLYTGTWGTGTPYVATGDLKAAGSTTRRARFLAILPPEYIAAQTVKIRASAGMLTTIADVAATIDFEAFVSGRDTTIDGSDIVTTAATTINSLTFANKDFIITETDLVPGSVLDIRLSVLVNDAATVTAVIAAIGAIELLLDIKG